MESNSPGNFELYRGGNASNCCECGSGEANTIRITFPNGDQEDLDLCEGCIAEFQAADLIATVREI